MSFIRDCWKFWYDSRSAQSNLEEIVVIEDTYYDAQTEKWIHVP